MLKKSSTTTQYWGILNLPGYPTTKHHTALRQGLLSTTFLQRSNSFKRKSPNCAIRNGTEAYFKPSTFLQENDVTGEAMMCFSCDQTLFVEDLWTSESIKHDEEVELLQSSEKESIASQLRKLSVLKLSDYCNSG